MDINRIENFFDLIKDTDIKELCWERNGLKLRIKRTENIANEGDVHIIDTKEEAHITHNSDLKNISSKFVGSFFYYGNGKKLNIGIGTKIIKGQVVGYIEAMNIFKEVISDIDGVISEVFVHDGAPIEYGQKLFSLTSL